jgi:hypothetical protein
MARNDLLLTMRDDSSYEIAVDLPKIVHGQAGPTGKSPMKKGDEYKQTIVAVGNGTEVFYYLKVLFHLRSRSQPEVLRPHF